MEVDKEEFLELLRNLFSQFLDGSKITSFPGNLPISLQRSHLFQLAFGYLFTFKADGIRSFIFCCEGQMFQIQRNLDITLLGVLPTQDLYLFDAEILPNEHKILLFDTMMFKGLNTLRTDISIRMELARCFLSSIGQMEVHDDDLTNLMFPQSNYKTKIFELENKNWQITTKPIFHYLDLELVWSKRHLLPFKMDGIVFYRKNCAYQPFRRDPMSLIKWKEEEEITLDFLFCEPILSNIKLVEIPKNKQMFSMNIGNILLSTTALYEEHPIYFSWVTLSQLEFELYKDKIVECRWDKIQGWKPLKIRSDKTAPNTLATVLETLNNILDPIFFNEILLFTSAEMET